MTYPLILFRAVLGRPDVLWQITREVDLWYEWSAFKETKRFIYWRRLPGSSNDTQVKAGCFILQRDRDNKF